MFDAETVKQLGLSFGGIATLAYILWQVWVKIRQQMKEDSKGDKIDDRIAAYSDNLQKTADKLVTKVDTLQAQNNDLVLKSAQMTAELVIAKAEAADLKAEVEKHIARIRYLESLLDKSGVNYV